jgi:hypothetical protein
VRRRLRIRFKMQCLALGSAALPWVGVCLAGDPGTSSSIEGREIMFYISQPIGPGAAARSFGFRLDQHSNPRALPGGTSSAAELSGRHELVNLRMAAHENMRIDFGGRRASWDFGRRQFTQPGDLLMVKGGFRDGAATSRAAGSVPHLAAALAMPVTTPLFAANALGPALP